MIGNLGLVRCAAQPQPCNWFNWFNWFLQASVKSIKAIKSTNSNTYWFSWFNWSSKWLDIRGWPGVPQSPAHVIDLIEVGGIWRSCFRQKSSDTPVHNQVMTGTMAYAYAKRVLECIDFGRPWYSEFSFVQAMAAFSAVFFKNRKQKDRWQRPDNSEVDVELMSTLENWVAV